MTNWICRKGEHRSAMKAKDSLTDSEMTELVEKLSDLGYERCIVGKKEKKIVRCPVQGDGYSYYRRPLYDSTGIIVGYSSPFNDLHFS